MSEIITDLPDDWAHKSTQRRWSSTNGWETSLVLEGPYRYLQAAADALPAGFMSLAVALDHWSIEDLESGQVENGKAVLTANYAYSGQSNEPDIPDSEADNYGIVRVSWQRTWLTEDRSLIEAPSLKAIRDWDLSANDSAGLSWLAAVEQGANAYRDYAKETIASSASPAKTIWDYYPPAPPGAPDTSKASSIFEELCRNGDASYTYYYPVLRKEVLARGTSASDTWTDYDGDVIYAQSGLLQAEPTLAQVSYLYAGLPDWYWIAGRPGIQESSDDSWAMQVDYTGVKEFNSGIYGTAVTAP